MICWCVEYLAFLTVEALHGTVEGVVQNHEGKIQIAKVHSSSIQTVSDVQSSQNACHCHFKTFLILESPSLIMTTVILNHLLAPR